MRNPRILWAGNQSTAILAICAHLDFGDRIMLGNSHPQDSSADIATLSEDGEQTDPTAKVVTAIMRAAELLRYLLTSDFSSLGITGARYAALKIIAQSPAEGCSQSELAVRLKQSESSVSGLVSRMRDDGLLFRLRCKDDQRKHVLMLSEQGRQLLVRCDASYRRRMQHVLSQFDANLILHLTEQMEFLVGRLIQIQKRLDRPGGCEARPDANLPERISA